MHFSIIFEKFPINFALFSDIEEGERKIFISSPTGLRTNKTRRVKRSRYLAVFFYSNASSVLDHETLISATNRQTQKLLLVIFLGQKSNIASKKYLKSILFDSYFFLATALECGHKVTTRA